MLIATQSFVYMNKRLERGDEIEVKSRQDERTLIAIGRAEKTKKKAKKPKPADVVEDVIEDEVPDNG